MGRAHLPGDKDNWFADGSKDREGARVGVYVKNSDTSLLVPLGPYSTVLQTEIAAILQCSCVARNYGRGRSIRICSDSRAAITTLDKSLITSTPVWECYEALNKLAEDSQVIILWAPGHRGIKGNETADRLAKLATKQNPTGLEPVIGISNRSVTEDFNKWLAEKHQEEWCKATACSIDVAVIQIKSVTQVLALWHGLWGRA